MGALQGLDERLLPPDAAKGARHRAANLSSDGMASKVAAAAPSTNPPKVASLLVQAA
jgi:hypothetical protein